MKSKSNCYPCFPVRKAKCMEAPIIFSMPIKNDQDFATQNDSFAKMFYVTENAYSLTAIQVQTL